MIQFKSIFLLVVLVFSSSSIADECVILLHGLTKSSGSMEKLEKALIYNGYKVANIDYPSRLHSIDKLAEISISQGINTCNGMKTSGINFVTHSLGGILVRQYYSKHRTSGLKRVVMLGPPNKGSEVVDKLKNVPGFELINGPAGFQLGTNDDSVPVKLGRVDFELGVIAGTRTINFILSTLIPGTDDGKVSVESTKVEGMSRFLMLPVSHPFIMKDNKAIEQTVHFLRHGSFASKS